jgi:putative YhbY family RNA-binding protein
MSIIEITPTERRDLRARAHALNPVVTIAGNGLTANVTAELDRSLQAHELIKVRIQGAERDQREALMIELCTQLEAAPVQHIGNVLIVWRPKREEPAKEKKAPEPVKNTATAKSAAAFAAAARRAALAKATAEQKRSAARKVRFQQPARQRTAPRGGK